MIAHEELRAAKEELVRLDQRRDHLLALIGQLERQAMQPGLVCEAPLPIVASVTNQCSREKKIAFFRSLFRGREDVFPRRFESKKTGKSGYQPACRNEWVEGRCDKRKVKCAECATPGTPWRRRGE